MDFSRFPLAAAALSRRLCARLRRRGHRASLPLARAPFADRRRKRGLSSCAEPRPPDGHGRRRARCSQPRHRRAACRRYDCARLDLSRRSHRKRTRRLHWPMGGPRRSPERRGGLRPARLGRGASLPGLRARARAGRRARTGDALDRARDRRRQHSSLSQDHAGTDPGAAHACSRAISRRTPCRSSSPRWRSASGRRSC